jgi:alkylation response protein AidB-like acyl-CoA dehydrogenase
MKTPGITIRPLYYFNGRHIYNEVFLDDVHVPVENRIGEDGQGWQVTQIMAGFERSGAGTIMVGKRMVDDLVKYCNETKVEGKLLAHDSVIRNRLAEAACEVEAARTLAYYVADQQRRPGGLGLFEASSVKIFSTELTERIGALGADILGTYGQVKTSKWAPQSGFWEDEYQWCLALEIAAGTNEIQRNIIAWMGLGMPRPPRPIPKA